MFYSKKYYTINPNISNGFVTVIIIILNWHLHKIQFSIPKLRLVTFELS